MVKHVHFVSRTKYYLLIAIALIALAEKGAPPLGLILGSSPLNRGGLGTSDFYEILKNKYSYVIPAISISDIDYPDSAEHCLYITISPEEPYTYEEAKHIINKLGKCRKPAILVADEFNTSNILLELVGFTARVAGDLIFSPTSDEDAVPTPYVRAFFNVSGETVEIILDKASMIAGGLSVLGYAEDVLVYSSDSVSRYPNVTVAVYDVSGKFRGIIIGDGSIFLNQVLRSKLSTNYTRVLLHYIDYLCSFNSQCAIVIEASKYHTISAEELFFDVIEKRSAGLSMEELLLSALLYALRLIHPSMWLQPLLVLTNNIAFSLYTNEYFSSILTLLTIVLIAWYILGSLERRVHDEKAEETREVEVFTTADVISSVISGKYKLTKKDFISLYEIVNYYLKYACGCSLDEASSADVLSRYVGTGKASHYVKNMNKLYMKATGRRKLPIVFSWGRVVKRYVKESEEVLRSIGYSLEAEKGYEYIAMRGFS